MDALRFMAISPARPSAHNSDVGALKFAASATNVRCSFSGVVNDLDDHIVAPEEKGATTVSRPFTCICRSHAEGSLVDSDLTVTPDLVSDPLPGCCDRVGGFLS